MNRKLRALAFVALFLAAGILSAENVAADFKPIRVDAGAGISFGLLSEKSDNATENTLKGFVTFMSTLRGSLYGSARYAFNENLSAGLQSGIYAVQYESSGTTTTLIDVPVHAVFRAEAGAFALEPFAGYYFSAVKSNSFDFAGAEFGVKASIGVFYGSWSMVAANPLYNRIEVGLQLSDLLKF